MEVIRVNKSLPLAFGAVSGEVKPVPESEIRAVSCFRDAVKLCTRLSRVKRTQNDLALLVGMKAPHFSKCLKNNFHLPGDVIPAVEKACGNTAITQWLALQHGATLKFETPEEKIARLEAELARRAA